MDLCRTTQIFIVLGVLISILFFIDLKKKKRKKFINSYQFPKKLKTNLLQTYPNLTSEQIELILNGLKEYFQICNIGGTAVMAMPSQIVNIAWQEFIFFTEEYKIFCKKSFGRFLRHIPTEAMESKTTAQESIKKIWFISCDRENIIPDHPDKLPTLFKLDVLLDINNGIKYTIDCNEENKDYYCAKHIWTNPINTYSSSGGDYGGGCDGGA